MQYFSILVLGRKEGRDYTNESAVMVNNDFNGFEIQSVFVLFYWTKNWGRKKGVWGTNTFLRAENGWNNACKVSRRLLCGQSNMNK